MDRSPAGQPAEAGGLRLHRSGKRCVRAAPKKPFGYLTEALDQLKPNEVYVATGAHNSALWGELLTATAKTRGAVGAVLDGYTRDTPQVLGQNFPVFCTGLLGAGFLRAHLCVRFPLHH